MKGAIFFILFVHCVFSQTITDEQVNETIAQAAIISQNGTVLPAPSTVDPTKLFIIVCTRSDVNGTRIPITAANQINSTSFNSSLPTKIYIFGWTSNPYKEGTVAVKNGILNKTDANVLILDWSVYTETSNYFDAYKAVEGTGICLGQFLADLNKFYPIITIQIIGHSLGAHVGGYAGGYNNGQIAVIIALDPAGPMFFQHIPAKRLNTGHALYVTAIHTSFLGAQFSLGHSDFWVNGGFYQPGCFDYMCSHKRAMYLYIESLADTIFGRKCISYTLLICNSYEQKKMGGLVVDTTANGDYHVTT